MARREMSETEDGDLLHELGGGLLRLLQCKKQQSASSHHSTLSQRAFKLSPLTWHCRNNAKVGDSYP